MNTDTEDLVATYDIELARQQVAAYPDSPEAAFILAVALTRTSQVEEALRQVQRARKLAESKGGPAYFDKMIASYEQLLKSYPKDNQVRYGLSWAYYMKAYLLAKYSRKSAIWKAAQAQLQAQAQNKAPNGAPPTPSFTIPAASAAEGKGLEAQGKVASGVSAPSKGAVSAPPAAGSSSGAAGQSLVNSSALTQLLSAGSPRKNDLMTGLANLTGALASLSANQPPPLNTIPHIPGALEKADPADIPQIRKYYELALKKLDDLLVLEPNDIWAIVYRAHLKAEYTGNLEEAMITWRNCQSKYPNNPAAYFFLGEGYLKQGNLKESINNVSKAIALRALGN